MSDNFVIAGTKNTRQRAAIKEALAHADEFRSAQELHMWLVGNGQRVSLPTVYRNLQLLAENREVETIRSEDGEILYRQCDTDNHHHHLVCRICSAAQDLPETGLEVWLTEVALQSGFTDISHSIELFGVCPQCSTVAG